MRKPPFLIALLILVSTSVVFADTETPQATVLNSANAKPETTLESPIPPDDLSTLLLNMPGSTGTHGGSPGGLITTTMNSAGVRTFDLTLDKTNVHVAIEQLMQVSGENYVLNISPFPGQVISARVKSIGLEEALNLLAKSANLIVRKENGVYIISMQDFSGYGGVMGGYGGGYGNTDVTPNQQAVPAAAGTPTNLTCPKCHKLIPQNSKYCYQCGVLVAPPNAPKGKSK